LPFVFAMWVARRESALHEIPTQLAAARDLGVSRLEAIAQREGSQLGIPAQEALAYLRDNLHFYLGPAEHNGLKLFHELAVRLGLAPRHSRLNRRDDQEPDDRMTPAKKREAVSLEWGAK
jgi:chorismate dehydratase